MNDINVETFEGVKELTGECLSSVLYWSSNVTELIPLRNAGQFATKQIPTDNFHETWKFDGIDEPVNVVKYVTPAGIRYVASEEGDHVIENAAAALGSIKSPAKAAASRTNGKLGGRPKTTAEVLHDAGLKAIPEPEIHDGPEADPTWCPACGDPFCNGCDK